MKIDFAVVAKFLLVDEKTLREELDQVPVLKKNPRFLEAIKRGIPAFFQNSQPTINEALSKLEKLILNQKLSINRLQLDLLLMESKGQLVTTIFEKKTDFYIANAFKIIQDPTHQSSDKEYQISKRDLIDTLLFATYIHTEGAINTINTVPTLIENLLDKEKEPEKILNAEQAKTLLVELGVRENDADTIVKTVKAAKALDPSAKIYDQTGAPEPVDATPADTDPSVTLDVLVKNVEENFRSTKDAIIAELTKNLTSTPEIPLSKGLNIIWELAISTAQSTGLFSIPYLTRTKQRIETIKESILGIQKPKIAEDAAKPASSEEDPKKNQDSASEKDVTSEKTQELANPTVQVADFYAKLREHFKSSHEHIIVGLEEELESATEKPLTELVAISWKIAASKFPGESQRTLILKRLDNIKASIIEELSKKSHDSEATSSGAHVFNADPQANTQKDQATHQP